MIACFHMHLYIVVVALHCEMLFGPVLPPPTPHAAKTVGGRGERRLFFYFRLVAGGFVRLVRYISI